MTALPGQPGAACGDPLLFLPAFPLIKLSTTYFALRTRRDCLSDPIRMIQLNPWARNEDVCVKMAVSRWTRAALVMDKMRGTFARASPQIQPGRFGNSDSVRRLSEATSHAQHAVRENQG